MVKAIGILLIATSLLSLIIGAFIDYRYGVGADLTGSAISDIKKANPGTTLAEYLEAGIISYSILSLIMGLMFLVRAQGINQNLYK